MRAVRNTERGVRVLDVPEPEGDGGRVRLAVRAASICGTDLEMARFGPIPFTLGHEFAGLLDDGRAVAVQPLVPCGACDRCAAGAIQQCRTATLHSYGLGADGGMADALLVDPGCLAPLPAGLAVADASLVEPLAVALHAANRCELEPGERVAVVGAGSIGLLCAAVARDRGCAVSVAARHPAQQRAAEALGASLGPSGEYDLVFEAAGSDQAFAEAVGACRPGGRVALVSTSWRPQTVSFLPAQLKEVTLVPAIVYGHAHGEREFDAAVRVLAEHPEVARALVTHRFPLDDAAEAFRVAADRAAGAIKVVLEP